MRHLLLPLALVAGPVFADEPTITEAVASPSGDTWRFSVTLAHPDTGWDHYADGWRVEDATGTVLGTRVLAHPHVNEQPFTRSLGSVVLPDGTTEVYIRAKCNVDGWGETTMRLSLPGAG